MTEEAIREIARVVEESAEADEALRSIVTRLAGEGSVAWAGVAFLEDGELTLGPSAGAPDESSRTRVPISYSGDLVGELVIDGTADEPALERVAELIAPLVLIGWDTRGEAWEP